MLNQNDGSMLEALKLINGQKLRLPDWANENTDRDRLAMRFERFTLVA
jgi:hypothetical protein